MSSPCSNLRRVKKSPLQPATGHSKVPYRQLLYQESEVPIPDHTLDDHTHRAIIDGLRQQQSTGVIKGRGTSHSDDGELLVSMVQRLGVVEREVLLSKKELVEKNEYISHLERNILTLESLSHDKHYQSGSPPGRSVGEDYVAQLEKHCHALQNQVDEMEEFLNDYGMVWVGGTHIQSHDQSHEQTGSVWSPSSSFPHPDEDNPINFDVIIKNVKALNILAGEGSSEVNKTPKGAHLKVLEPVPLTLYKNGLALFCGPFRPYSDPSTQCIITDLSDGYFPSELQLRYPEGIPLAINDQRDVMFHPRTTANYFPGSGHLLGGDRGPSRLLPSGSVLRTPPKLERDKRDSCDLPGQKLSMDQFLDKLPSSVVKRGRVLKIRQGIKDTLQGGGGCVPNLMLVDTEVLEEMKNRLNLTEDVRPPTPSTLTTLCIKSEKGETYVLKLKQSETIGDVRRYIDKLRSKESPLDYVLKSTFPTRSLENTKATLAQCGLVPSATIHMATRTNS